LRIGWSAASICLSNTSRERGLRSEAAIGMHERVAGL
jgi:hypothetical protein